MVISAAAPATTILVSGILYLRSRNASRLAEKDIVVLADFTNRTGDPVFDDTLNTALGIALKQSPFLNVLSDNKVAATLELMTRPANTVLTPEVTKEICLGAGGKAYIAGSIVPLGRSYILTLRTVTCLNGDLLGEEQVTASAKEEVVDSLGKATSKLRGRLGESLVTLKSFDVPLEQATTPSLEALKEYSIAQRGGTIPVTHLKRAIELDPDFAMAYLALGWDYFGVAELGQASEYFTTAFRFREHANALEKLKITADYYANVTGELEKAQQAYEELAANYPRNPEVYPWNLTYAAQGKYEKALAAYQQALGVGREYFAPYQNMGLVLLALQRFDEARDAVREARQTGPDFFLNHTELYALAFLTADSKTMAEQPQWYAGKAEYETFGLALASDTESYKGSIRSSEDLSRRAVESAIRAQYKETAAVWQQNTALGIAAIGNAKEAQRLAVEGLKLAPTSPGVEAEAALAFAMSGDTVRARALAEKLNQRFPKDTQMQMLWLPAIHAQVALDQQNASGAISQLQNTVPPIEFGQIMFLNSISCLYPTYIRGQVYLAVGQGKEAATEFQKILNHSGIVWNCWTGALAHLGMARAYALEAKTLPSSDASRARALAAYQEFLTLWKDADPDVPIYKRAKAEYAQLQQITSSNYGR